MCESLVNTQLVTHYSPQIQNAQDYFPFGMIMPGRSVQDLNNTYRYGFQNQETDKELWDGAVSYKYRIEDPRLGRFFSVDPLAPKYPHNSTYAFSENQVIAFVELEGLEKFYAGDGTQLGSVGVSDQMYIVSDKKNWDEYINGTKDAKALDILKNSSTEVFHEKELTSMIKKWGEQNYKKSQNQEYGMIIFWNTLTNVDGTKTKVIVQGTTVTDESKESVRVDDSRLYLSGILFYGDIQKDILNVDRVRKGGWNRYAAVHTHPSGALERQEFSVEDYGWSLESNLPLFMIPYDTRILMRFNPYKYNQITRIKFAKAFLYGEASFDKDALKICIDQYKIW